ncbi:MAG: DNA repair protein RecO [Candidatus Saccharimonadales bacterium]
MNQIITTGVILNRIDYGEADRILTVLTPDQGKLRLIAKGVRRSKSKLAGGIELFSLSQITFIRGRSEIGTLISARMGHHYGNIVKNIERTMLGYELIKLLNKNTEDAPEAEYFELLRRAYEALNNCEIAIEIINLWFLMQLLGLAGHAPNLHSDVRRQKLVADKNYNFSFDDMAFLPAENGQFSAKQIKFLRLGFSHHKPKILSQIQSSAELAESLNPLIETIKNNYLRL